jgi:hypothetical protein
VRADAHGRAVQVDSIKPKLKPPGTKHLKLRCDTLLSTSAFKFNSRRYNMAGPAADRLRVAGHQRAAGGSGIGRGGDKIVSGDFCLTQDLALENDGKWRVKDPVGRCRLTLSNPS